MISNNRYTALTLGLREHELDVYVGGPGDVLMLRIPYLFRQLIMHPRYAPEEGGGWGITTWTHVSKIENLVRIP